MMQTIVASVGRMGGMNRPQDVKVVQELLNRVPRNEGGPIPFLDVDCLCGPRTIAAIQNFQVRQLGWSKADGRVDPGGPTLQKLNETGGGDKLWVPMPLTSESVLECPHGGRVTSTVIGRPAGTRHSPVPLKATDRFDISGCAFQVRPCVRVQWVAYTTPLSEMNVGLCVDAAGSPQGPVMVIATRR